MDRSYYHRNTIVQEEACLHQQQFHPRNYTHTFTPLIPLTYTSRDTIDNLAWPMHLAHTSSDCGRKPEELRAGRDTTGQWPLY